jgi:hypothetical protein
MFGGLYFGEYWFGITSEAVVTADPPYGATVTSGARPQLTSNAFIVDASY